MVLVAATAVGLAMARWIMPTGESRLYFGDRLQYWVYWVWTGPPSCIALAWGFALLLIRLRAPRPRWRRLTRQPGFVASTIAIGSIPVALLQALGWVLIRLEPALSRTSDFYSPEWYWGSATEMIPAPIVGAWLALALSKRWDPEPTWVDRMGRGLGLFWIIPWPVRTLYSFIQFAFVRNF